MPYCTHCGSEVQPTAAFCARCGNRQPGVPPVPPAAKGEDWMQSIQPNTAATLCYAPFIGWIAALIVLATQRFRGDRVVRFHAFQGLYLFVVWLLVDMVAASVFGFAGFAVRRALVGSLKLSVVCAWIYMLYKTSMGQVVRLPFIADLAERSVAEQSTPGV